MNNNKESGLISVLIPAYNHSAYVEQAIRSVMKQTYQNVELIIIDDGSMDDTWEKINLLKVECQNRFSRVIFETQVNKGVAVTCKDLLAKAQGGYICLLASDDLLKPEALQCMYDVMSINPEYGLVVGDNELIDHTGNVIFWNLEQETIRCTVDTATNPFKTFASYLKKIRSDVDFLSDTFGQYETLLAGNYIPNGYLIRKSIIDRVDAYNVKAPLEDWYLMLQISKISKLKFIDTVLFSYRWHETNSIKNRARIWEFTRITFDVEVSSVLNGTDAVAISRLDCFFRKNTKTYIRVGQFFQLFRVKTFLYKEYGLKLQNKVYSKIRYRN